MQFNDSGSLIQIIEVPVIGQYNDLVLDSEGRIYLAGASGNQACLVVLGSDGALLANIVFIEGEAKGLCLGNMGEIYITGASKGSNFVAMLCRQGFSYSKKNREAKKNELPNVEPYWITLRDPAICSIDGIIIDSLGNLLVGGMSTQTWGNPLRPFQGGKDAFVVSLDGDGHLLWNTFLGGALYDGFSGIAQSEKGDIAVIGWSDCSWGNPVCKFKTGYLAKTNNFGVCLDGTGQLLWNTFWGDGGCFIQAPAMDTQGNIFMTGSSYESWGKPLWPYNVGGCYVAKVDQDGYLLWHAFLPLKKPLPKDYDYDSTYASTIVLSQGSIFITGTCGWIEPGFEASGETFAFLDKITETNGKTKFRIDHQLPEK